MSFVTLSLLLFFAHSGKTTTTAKTTTAVASNVLLLISDDLRAEIDAKGYGCNYCSTPNLDSFSKSAQTISFSRAYVQQALCAPSRNSFLTGRRPDATKSYNFIDHFREPGIGLNWTSFPQFFKERGYNVFGTGKIFHPRLPPNWDIPKSWDDRMMSGSWKQWMYPSEPKCDGDNGWCSVGNPEGAPDEDHVSDFEDLQVTERALEIFDNLTRLEQPWFLAVGYRKPHVQWRAPARCFDRIANDSVSLPKYRFFPKGSPDIAFHQPINDFLEPFADVRDCGGEDRMTPTSVFDDSCQIKWRRAYHAAVSFMDEQIGRMLTALETSGQANRTVVVIFGDHGWQIGEFGEWEKFTNFELAARVPLLIRASAATSPSVKRKNSVVEGTIVELIDVMPTVIELAMPWISADTLNVDGKSRASSWVRVKNDNSSIALTQFPRCVQAGEPVWKANDCDDVERSKFSHMGLSVRTDRWRYTKWLPWNGTTLRPMWNVESAGIELYDHLGDDGTNTDGAFESINLASTYPGIAKALDRKLKAAFQTP